MLILNLELYILVLNKNILHTVRGSVDLERNMLLDHVFHSMTSAVFCYRFNQFGKTKRKTRF